MKKHWKTPVAKLVGYEHITVDGIVQLASLMHSEYSERVGRREARKMILAGESGDLSMFFASAINTANNPKSLEFYSEAKLKKMRQVLESCK